MKYTNGDETVLNKCETKVSWKITMGGTEVQNGVWKGVMTQSLSGGQSIAWRGLDRYG